MSHATVLVISRTGEYWEIEEMMKPFYEYLDEPESPYTEFFVEIYKEDLQKEFEEHNKKYRAKAVENPDKQQYVYETPEKFLKDWHGLDIEENYSEEFGGWGRWGPKNPKWDWWTIGGRWAGLLLAKENPQGEGRRGEPSWTWGEQNPYNDDNRRVDSLQVKNLDPEFAKNFVSYAVLDENGWHEKSQLGWWGMSCYDGYCCIAEELTFHEILQHFKYGIWGIGGKWKGYTNEYVALFIKALHKYYTKDGKVWRLKPGFQGQMKEEGEENRISFFRDKHWSKNFYKRFIEPLDEDMWLTVVDYHI